MEHNIFWNTGDWGEGAEGERRTRRRPWHKTANRLCFICLVRPRLNSPNGIVLCRPFLKFFSELSLLSRHFTSSSPLVSFRQSPSDRLSTVGEVIVKDVGYFCPSETRPSDRPCGCYFCSLISRKSQLPNSQSRWSEGPRSRGLVVPDLSLTSTLLWSKEMLWPVLKKKKKTVRT